jgi:DNA-binding transcriptional ArsR family regulator
MKFTNKQTKLLEIYFKAVANKKRVRILILINEIAGLNVEEISRKIKIKYQTAANHIQILERVGFIYKRYEDLEVLHTIAPRGKNFLKFFEDILIKK